MSVREGWSRCCNGYWIAIVGDGDSGESTRDGSGSMYEGGSEESFCWDGMGFWLGVTA